MEIYTLNVSQGQFVVVVGTSEAFIADTYVPLSSEQDTVFVKAALSKILAGKRLIGLLVTGFDDDHFCEVGMKLVLNKYRPDWLMYPKYFKRTDTADRCFAAIKVLEGNKEISKKSIVLEENIRRIYDKLSTDFAFEIFSPHRADMNSSNNCSIVCKVKERTSGASYLITGDTENDRWGTIVKEFDGALKSDVLAAAHHGSENGITEDALRRINPHTILVSAGVGNQYGHPHASAKALFDKHAQKWWGTHVDKGQSLRTVADGKTVATYKFVV
jgi:beta-lactamase superfamily II metal-dependent hydrolase